MMDAVQFMLEALGKAKREGRRPRRWQINRAAEIALVAHPDLSVQQGWTRPLHGRTFFGIPITVGRASDGNDDRVLIELMVEED